MNNMSFLEGVSISVMGLLTVFLILISLALAIKLVSWILKLLNIGETDAPKAVSSGTPSGDEKIEDELYAAIIAAVSAELKLPIDRFRIVAINEK